MKRYFYGLKGVLILHFFVVILYQISMIYPNQRQLSFVSIIHNNYLVPFFEQSWSMFAPNPPTTTDRVLLKYRIGKIETEWIDISQPNIEGNRHSYFSVNQRIMKYLHGILSKIQSDSKKLEGEKNVNYDKVRSSVGYRSLQQYAKLVLNKKYSRVIKNEKVFLMVRVINDAFPNFEHRELSFNNPKNHYLTYFEIPFEELK